VLTVELPIHQHVINVYHLFSRIQEVLDNFQSGLPLPNWPCVQYNRNGIPD
jgi:hypothetical protein